MNNNFYKHALQLINQWSLKDLEDKLQKFGIDCERINSITDKKEIISILNTKTNSCG